VRIATFNILHGRSPGDGRVDLDRFAAAVASLDADVLALQEVDRDQPRSMGADLTAVAASAMGATSHHFAAALAGTPSTPWQAATGAEQPGSAMYGIALLSRYSVTDWQTIRLPAGRLPLPHVVQGRMMPLLVRDEARVALVATVSTPRAPLTVAATHLSFLPTRGRQQLRLLMRSLRGRRGPLVLAGDLNMDPPSVAELTGLSSLAAGLTFPADEPRRQLDHIVGRGFRPVASAVVALGLSDHRALLVDGAVDPAAS
jgi:endonuclease/exonuclease/phosphatase family metal-dependent hydrolase